MNEMKRTRRSQGSFFIHQTYLPQQSCFVLVLSSGLAPPQFINIVIRVQFVTRFNVMAQPQKPMSGSETGISRHVPDSRVPGSYIPEQP
jgi:hypothetical protein